MLAGLTFLASNNVGFQARKGEIEDFAVRIISPAIRLAVKRFGPTQAGIDPAHFVAVFVEFDLEERMLLLPPADAAHVV